MLIELVLRTVCVAQNLRDVAKSPLTVFVMTSFCCHWLETRAKHVYNIDVERMIGGSGKSVLLCFLEAWVLYRGRLEISQDPWDRE